MYQNVCRTWREPHGPCKAGSASEARRWHCPAARLDLPRLVIPVPGQAKVVWRRRPGRPPATQCSVTQGGRAWEHGWSTGCTRCPCLHACTHAGRCGARRALHSPCMAHRAATCSAVGAWRPAARTCARARMFAMHPILYPSPRAGGGSESGAAEASPAQGRPTALQACSCRRPSASGLQLAQPTPIPPVVWRDVRRARQLGGVWHLAPRAGRHPFRGLWPVLIHALGRRQPGRLVQHRKGLVLLLDA